MIVFAGLIPTNDLFLRNPKNISEKTQEGLRQLRVELDQARPETIVIISNRAGCFNDAFTLPFNTKMSESLKKFGIITTHIPYQIDTALLSNLQSVIQKRHLPLRSVHTEFVDAQTAIAMRSLELQNQYPMIIIGTSSVSPDEHMRCGEELKDFFHAHHRRIAILISTEISEHSSPEVGNAIALRDISILNPNTMTASTTRTLGMTFGLLKNFPNHVRIISNEIYLNIAWLIAVLYAA